MARFFPWSEAAAGTAAAPLAPEVAHYRAKVEAIALRERDAATAAAELETKRAENIVSRPEPRFLCACSQEGKVRRRKKQLANGARESKNKKRNSS